MSKILFSRSLDDLPQVCDRIITQSKSNTIFTFEGALGAGKTSLIKAMCRCFGYQGEVTSPTFALINEYKVEHNCIYHMDLYRINRVEELHDIGLEEYIASGQYCLIEWPQIAQEFLADKHIQIKIDVMPNQVRKIEIFDHT